MADGRNFRSFYYDTLGLKNVEQKKALEILLNSEEIGKWTSGTRLYRLFDRYICEHFTKLHTSCCKGF